jgi:hypothetical protein
MNELLPSLAAGAPAVPPSAVLAYLGPDALMPLASGIAAVLGVILVFWGFLLQLIKRPFRTLFARKAVNNPEPPPLQKCLRAEPSGRSAAEAVSSPGAPSV